MLKNKELWAVEILIFIHRQKSNEILNTKVLRVTSDSYVHCFFRYLYPCINSTSKVFQTAEECTKKYQWHSNKKNKIKTYFFKWKNHISNDIYECCSNG